MTTTGTYAFNLTGDDLSLEILERVGIRSSSVVPDHMKSLLRSINLVQSTWANRGVNLWKVDLVTVALSQGVTEYAVDPKTVMVLDMYLRNYYMNGANNLAVDFSTVASSTTVTIGWPNHGLLAGQYMTVIIPISVGGIVLLGFYQVASVPSTDTLTIISPTAATATVNNGGAVPVFSTTGGSAAVNVNLADHGLSIGSTFVVQEMVSIGGIALSGTYTVSNYVDADNFTIQAASPAGYNQTLPENGGEAQLSGQVPNAQPYDRIMTPISRNDYAALPNKATQSPPTQYWFDRLRGPTLTVYPAPDQNGPYSMQYYRVTQIEDASINGNISPDIPYRFLEAMCSGAAAHMAVKWRPEALQMLKGEAAQAWSEAAGEDRERVTWQIQPEMGSYFS